MKYDGIEKAEAVYTKNELHKVVKKTEFRLLKILLAQLAISALIVLTLAGLPVIFPVAEPAVETVKNAFKYNIEQAGVEESEIGQTVFSENIFEMIAKWAENAGS